MSATHESIEATLRKAPRPRPPSGLRERLLQDVALPSTSSVEDIGGALSWLRRWRAALAGASVAALTLVVCGVQQSRISVLEQQLETWKADRSALSASTVSALDAPAWASVPEGSAASSPELEQLRQEVARLSTVVSALDALKLENARLRDQLRAGSGATPEEMGAMEEMREKARRIRCVNNLKQLGLAGRIWASDHEDVFPPDVLSMTNAMGTPKILFCPSDGSAVPVDTWEAYTGGSYLYYGPFSTDMEPNRVLFSCPFHGHIGLCDGSVHQALLKTNPERFTEQDGRLYLGQPPAAAPAGSDSRPTTPESMAERYGVLVVSPETAEDVEAHETEP